MSRTIFVFSKKFFRDAIQWCESELGRVGGNTKRAAQLKSAIRTFKTKCERQSHPGRRWADGKST